MDDTTKTIDAVRALYFDTCKAEPHDAAICVLASLVDPKLTPNARVLLLVRVGGVFFNLALTDVAARDLSDAITAARGVATGGAV